MKKKHDIRLHDRIIRDCDDWLNSFEVVKVHELNELGLPNESLVVDLKCLSDGYVFRTVNISNDINNLLGWERYPLRPSRKRITHSIKHRSWKKIEHE